MKCLDKRKNRLHRPKSSPGAQVFWFRGLIQCRQYQYFAGKGELPYLDSLPGYTDASQQWVGSLETISVDGDDFLA